MPSELFRDNLQGKTYSLRPAATDSDAYYRRVAGLTDDLLQSHSDPAEFLAHLRELSQKRRHLRTLATNAPLSDDAILVHALKDQLSEYTVFVDSHLAGLRFRDRWKRTLTTSEEQYHLYMIEIELTNRIFAPQFRESSRRLAFLPHCLRDLSAKCLAAQRDLDYVCKGCTGECTVNQVSKTLRRHEVKPYIWMEANLRSLFRKSGKKESLGMLGIACIPELVRGMRLCRKYEIPVVGVPLDANRCARWWGEFHWNSVNIRMLESLL